MKTIDESQLKEIQCFLMEVYKKCKDNWTAISPGSMAVECKIPYQTGITSAMIKKGYLLRQPDGHGHFQYKWNKEIPTISDAKILLKKIRIHQHPRKLKNGIHPNINQVAIKSGFKSVMDTIEQLRKIGVKGKVIIPEMEVIL
jgi:hypothetical protein